MPATRLTNPATVEVALHHEALVPPDALASIGNGATAHLRTAMARFSSGDAHALRRMDVERALETLAQIDVRSLAESATRRRLNTVNFEAFEHIGFVVPSEALGEALGLPSADHPSLVADVRAIVEVVGRRMPAGDESDAATARLRQRLADHPGGADANVSLLYQNFDATAALLASKLVALDRQVERRAALAKTVRLATADVDIGGCSLTGGELVELSLDDVTLEFGAGRHRCPGERLAHDIVDGMVVALDDWYLDVALMQIDPEGRPTSLPMRRRR